LVYQNLLVLEEIDFPPVSTLNKINNKFNNSPIIILQI